ncbi:HAD family hydrolase [Thaumasiovibrio subtropicus]|uniref:HAD family hydrolase n=1 Tax=Thaumasiovibrio subtropicus TaxID=1891207 RepID=UPI000B3515F6|nr:HAD family phosphatase [Thaumasiovibrio subtropicus]
MKRRSSKGTQSERPSMFNNVQAVMFDMDGTLIHSKSVIEEAWRIGALAIGRKISPEEMEAHVHGRNADYTFRYFFGHLSSTELAEIKTIVNDYEATSRPALIDGAKCFLTQLKQSNIKIGLVTGSWQARVAFVLALHGLDEYFDIIITRENVSQGKPNPEGFLQCARQLNVPITQCLIFEDSQSGVQSAIASGAECVVISQPNDEKIDETLPHVRDFTGYLNGKTD